MDKPYEKKSIRRTSTIDINDCQKWKYLLVSVSDVLPALCLASPLLVTLILTRTDLVHIWVRSIQIQG